ncbi:hypothetical protein EK21DRAFT_77580 [Setomelanomma holmii]|uniref:F-box domain-containing protein n=1 Tax=Setomelanomma holmii TaxID=210430 RepID=A0A9P4LH27_9PLEO|nr:hypothetical protein EK21DRAFT_77580 [Setomelanomma holmii]
MTSPLERLPVEVCELILCDLDLAGYRNFRIASRQLHLLSLSTFSKRFFPRLTTTLGSPSLDRLVKISNHQNLCDVVTRLDIKLLTHREYKLLTNIAKVGIYPPPKRFPVVSTIKHEHIKGEATLYNDVLSRKYPQCIVDRLTRALHGFSNLKTIRFRTEYSEPAGWVPVDMPNGDQLFRAKCFTAVFDAIFKSEVQLEEFGMSKKKKTTGLFKRLNLHYPALQFPFSSHPSLRHCFAHLQSLDLSIITTHQGDIRVPGWENGLSHFIMCAPALKSLALSLGRDKHVSEHSAVIVRSLALSCHLPLLERFHLVNSTLTEGYMTAFMARHRDSIHELIFKNCRMMYGTWMPFLKSLQDFDGLQCLRLSLQEGLGSPGIIWPKPKAKITLDVQDSGRSMRDMLENVVAKHSAEANNATADHGW